MSQNVENPGEAKVVNGVVITPPPSEKINTVSGATAAFSLDNLYGGDGSSGITGIENQTVDTLNDQADQVVAEAASSEPEQENLIVEGKAEQPAALSGIDSISKTLDDLTKDKQVSEPTLVESSDDELKSDEGEALDEQVTSEEVPVGIAPLSADVIAALNGLEGKSNDVLDNSDGSEDEDIVNIEIPLPHNLNVESEKSEDDKKNVVRAEPETITVENVEKTKLEPELELEKENKDVVEDQTSEAESDLGILDQERADANSAEDVVYVDSNGDIEQSKNDVDSKKDEGELQPENVEDKSVGEPESQSNVERPKL
jgi:hypothetical protein